MARNRSRSIFLAIGLTVAASAAHAQATRTWVSGVGDDVNPCSRTAPCKTWAGAISKTASGGIIDALDPGGFGAVTITKPMTLEGNGTLASTLSSGVNGIIVNITSGTGRNVVLRNILIDGSGVTLGTNGIRFIAGDSLLVEDCYIKAYSAAGIDFENDSGIGQLIVRRTTISQTAQAVLVKPQAAATAARATIHDSLLTTSGVGVRAEDKANVNIYESRVSGNFGDGVVSFAAGGIGTVVVVANSQISGNTGAGLKTSGANAFIKVSASNITGNAVGLDHAAGGSLETYQNNVFVLNSTQGTFTGNAVPGLQ
jgi:Right handed beta helix region